MRVLVTGANGQLGKVFKEEVEKCSIGKDYTWYFCSRDEVDITNYDETLAFIEMKKINVVINCAAYTNVEKAEEDQENAETVNSSATENLARACKKTGAFLFHFSTDFVFDGEKNTPYTTTDDEAPLSVYGETKLKGENNIILTACNYAIIRTSWLYSEIGPNFVTKMLSAIGNNEEKKIVEDQIGRPTYARDLAHFVITLLNRGTIIENKERTVIHFSNMGICSWYDLAKAIEDIYNKETGKSTNVIKSCYSSDFETKAERPHYSALSLRLTENFYDYQIPYWRDSLETCVKNLLATIYKKI